MRNNVKVKAIMSKRIAINRKTRGRLKNTLTLGKR